MRDERSANESLAMQQWQKRFQSDFDNLQEIRRHNERALWLRRAIVFCIVAWVVLSPILVFVARKLSS